MSACRKVFALIAGLLFLVLACKQPVEDKAPPPPPDDMAVLTAGDTKAEPISAEALTQAVARARAQAGDAADPSTDPRKFVETFQSKLRPELEKLTGQDLPPLPINPRASAMPMYSNYAAMIMSSHKWDVYTGDSQKGALRFETVALPLANDSPCTAIIIARNAIATARHCAEKKPERIRLGTTVKGGKAIEIDPKGFVFLKTQNGTPLDMAILVRKDPIKDLKDADLPVFASQSMIDQAIELQVVGYGGAKANSSDSGTKRLGAVPMLSPDCNDPDVAKDYKCKPGFEIVAGSRAMFDRMVCPTANDPDLIKGACKGDSGGPVYVEGEDKKLYLAALISSIHKGHCECATAINLYVRFDKQLGAIKSLKDIDFHPEAFSKTGTP